MVGNWTKFCTILVVYLGHGIFSSGSTSSFTLLPHQYFWGEVLSSQIEENAEKRGCTYITSRLSYQASLDRMSPFQKKKNGAPVPCHVSTPISHLSLMAEFPTLGSHSGAGRVLPNRVVESSPSVACTKTWNSVEKRRVIARGFWLCGMLLQLRCAALDTKRRLRLQEHNHGATVSWPALSE